MNTLLLIESALNTTWYLILITFLVGVMVPVFMVATEFDDTPTRIGSGVAFICLVIGILAHPLVGIL